MFGVADRLGSIEKGKIANLVIADGDLFNEKTKIKYVLVDGQRFTVREPEKPKDPPKGDITGKWKLIYTTPEGPEESIAGLIHGLRRITIRINQRKRGPRISSEDS